MLLLNQQEILRSVTLEQVMDQVEEAYRIVDRGDFQMPDRLTVEHQGNTFCYMPCLHGDTAAVKILSLSPKNPARGLPYIRGIMLLSDGDSGQTLALLDGGFLTALRTGAVGGVGMRHFSRPDCHSVGVVGAGTQGFYQALYACHARDIQQIYLLDRRPVEDAYVQRLRDTLAAYGKAPQITVCANDRELLEHSDIVVTATTSAQPVLSDDENLLRGKCFVGVGSARPDMRELPDAIWPLVERVYVEDPFACQERGDLALPLANGLLEMDRVAYIGALLNGPAHALPKAGETTFFKSVGIGVLDLCVSQLIYQRAVELGLGQTVDL